MGNFLHAMGQLAEEVPEATGKALSKTADELANNEELREKLGWALKAGLGTVGAGALPAAINYLGIPAVKYMLQHPELINEATDAVEGFGMPGPPPSSWGGSIGGFLSALGDRL